MVKIPLKMALILLNFIITHLYSILTYLFTLSFLFYTISIIDSSESQFLRFLKIREFNFQILSILRDYNSYNCICTFL